MITVKTDILPGVNLNYIRSDKFKISYISVSMLSQLCRENASLNALVPIVLRRGSRLHPDMESLSARLDELYGSTVEPAIRRIGEIQCVGFFATFPEADFLPGKQGVLNDVTGLIAELMTDPVTEGGLLSEEYTASEKGKLADIIRSGINEKRSYAVKRCIEEMCCYEDYSTGRLGSAEACEEVTTESLTERYRTLIRTAPIELFYCGRESLQTVESAFKKALGSLERGEIDYDIGTDVRLNSIEAQPRYCEEELNVNQGKLVLGFRLGDAGDSFTQVEQLVFSSVLGGSPTSKLFMNVREKLSLCYYIGSSMHIHKGLLLITCGIDFDKFEAARDEIFNQINEIKLGNIADDELASAKAGIISDYQSMQDSAPELENFAFVHAITGSDRTPEEICEEVANVSASALSEIAASIECDMIYFLKGGGEDDEYDED